MHLNFRMLAPIMLNVQQLFPSFKASLFFFNVVLSVFILAIKFSTQDLLPRIPGIHSNSNSFVVLFLETNLFVIIEHSWEGLIRIIGFLIKDIGRKENHL